MMLLKCYRRFFGDTFTEGDLFMDGVFFCYTLEDRAIDWRTEPKVPGKTAIPAGRYRVTIEHSPAFKRRMVTLLNVPHFDGIRVHRGNTAIDTKGCPLVGEIKTSPADGFIGDSAKAEKRLFEAVERALGLGQEVWWEIIEEREPARKHVA